jgi:hypothetical protein
MFSLPVLADSSLFVEAQTGGKGELWLVQLDLSEEAGNTLKAPNEVASTLRVKSAGG